MKWATKLAKKLNSFGSYYVNNYDDLPKNKAKNCKQRLFQKGTHSTNNQKNFTYSFPATYEVSHDERDSLWETSASQEIYSQIAVL